MEDRVSLYPGRVTLTPVEGQANTYDMVRADQPTQAGTPLSKANLLKDTTAAQFGLGSEAVPDDVLSWVGKYAEYWWELTVTTTLTLYKETETTFNAKTSYSQITIDSNKGTTYVAETVNFDINTGEYELVNPKVLDGRLDSTYKNYYIQSENGGIELGDYSGTPFTDILHVTSAKMTSSSVGVIKYTVSTSVVLGAEAYTVTTGDTFFVHSPGRNAYPDSGTVDGITYTFLGRPFEKFPTMLQIETGSYTGAGTYGASNPNSLTFGFVPKIIFIVSKTLVIGSKTVVCGTLFVALQVAVNYGTASSQGETHISVSGKTVSWYSTDNAQKQFNMAATYDYIALG